MRTRSLSLLVLLAVAALLPAVPARAQAPAPGEPTTLTVVETATARAEPDSARLTFELSRRGTTAPRARRDVDRRVRVLVARIIRAGIPRAGIQTSAISSSRVRLRARRGVPARVRYDARTIVTVVTDRVDRVGRVIAEAERSGVSRVFGPEFTVEDATEARAAAARTALERARRRAADAAEALGLRVVAIRSVVLDPQASGVEADFQEGSGARAERRSDVVVEPGTEQVTATVAVVFVLGP